MTTYHRVDNIIYLPQARQETKTRTLRWRRWRSTGIVAAICVTIFALTCRANPGGEIMLLIVPVLWAIGIETLASYRGVGR